MSEEKSIGSGLRSYFRFSFATLGTTVGNTGFVFAAIDSESNPVSPCGGAGSHLGYSGDNISPPKLAFPKIGIEFDQSRNGTFVDGRVESDTNKGRNDPCYTCGSGTADSHAAIVYWGHESINTIDGVTLPYFDDNVHGFPTTGSLATARRPPKNPNAEPGIIDIPGLRTGGKVYHVRVEMTPTRNFASAAENSTTSIQTKVWILLDGVSEHQAAALKNTTRPMSQLYPSYTETLNDTAVIYDVAGIACVSGSCATGQACGTDNVCYRQGLKNMRLGFTNSQRTQDQQITINDLFTTWLP
jgi:hypothetical protein